MASPDGDEIRRLRLFFPHLFPYFIRPSSLTSYFFSPEGIAPALFQVVRCNAAPRPATFVTAENGNKKGEEIKKDDKGGIIMDRGTAHRCPS